MIPVKLTLKNFMSYGEERTELNFAGMHVISLSGDNGNGKSALLDAMTYALWGKTRASGSQVSSEEDLIRLGAEDMEVTFEFLLGEDRYRVVKKRSRRTRSGDWQVHLCDLTGVWRPVGATGTRETEKVLVRILRMEYETFLNSAYIQQGHADEFTRQKPDARKRILADILDLSRYDHLEELAKAHRNECDLQLKELDGEIRLYESRAGEGEALRGKLLEQESALLTWTTERTVREEKLNDLRKRQAALDEKAQFLQRREEMLKEAEHEVADVDAQIARLRLKMEQDAELIKRKPAILKDYQALQNIRTELERLEADVTTLRAAQQSRAKLEGELALRRQELQSELSAASAEAERLEQQELLLREMESQLADLMPKLELLGSAKKEMESLRSKRTTAQEAFNELAAQNKKLRTDITDLEEVLSLLAEPKPACPVCQTDLSGGKHAMVLDRQKQRLRAFQENLAVVKKEGVELKRKLDDLVKQEESLEAQLRGEAALNAQRIEWQKRRDEADRYIKEAGDVKGRLLELRRRTEKEDYGQKERADLALIAQQIAGLEGKAVRFSEAQAILRDLTSRQVEREYARLEEAERAQQADLAEIERMSARRNKRIEQINTEREKQATLRVELRDYEAIRLQTLSAERENREASEATDAARAQVERTRHALEDVARALELMAKKKIERDKLAKDKQAYTELAAAFGKRGVQALIIENILPELQDETNRLLARLTDNSMQVGIDTLRAARTGSHQIETLDIQITDDAGTRPYEMYSGGEAFRVNFAIRIALSRLLARRAGARLQTLVIDEGFGTQDAKGRERLVEAIEAVKDEFALILVISHIEELKDAFPSRIEITKTPTGSQITYMD